MCFPSPDIPAPPPAQTPPPALDPNEVAKRRAAEQARRTTRDSLLIDPGVGNSGSTGTGLRIG